MKKQIRWGVFETNSSSVHSLTICDADTFKKWENGELLYNQWNDEFIKSITELSDDQKEDAKTSYMQEMEEYWKGWDDLSEEEKGSWYQKYAEKHGLISEDAKTYNEYFGDWSYETYAEEYTTKSGDNIVAFGYYGA